MVWNIWIMFHFIYGMSFFPLTNSYFSRWLKQPTNIYIYIYIYTLRLVVFIFAFWEGKLMLYLSTPQCVWMCIVSPGSFKGAALRGIPEAIHLNTNRRSRLWTPAGLSSVISSWEDYHILVGGLEHGFYDFISYMGCHPSHWLPSGYLT